MGTGLALWQEVVLVGLAGLSLVYVLYFRIWVTLATGSDLLFAVALAVSVASVALPNVFERVATQLVDHSPLPEALANADRRVADLEALPAVLIDRALESIGYERELEELELEPLPPGPFETRIRPALEALLAAVLRTTSFVCASLLLMMALALRSSTSTARELRALALRLDRIESRDEEGPRSTRGQATARP
jgi:hypothetical protein